MMHRLARRQRLPQAMAALALVGGLVGCSGTPFGDQLARSFSPAPPAPAAADPAATPPAATATGSATRPAAPPPTSGTSGAAPQPGPSAPGGATARSAQGKPAAPARPAPGPPPPASPAPYRITLRLPGADPSAPAEAVTEALRAAGLSFEVEMIERVRTGTGAAGTSGAPTATPAPPPR